MVNRRGVICGAVAMGGASAFGFGALGAQGGAWREGASLPHPVQEIYAAALGDEIWVPGGLQAAPAGGITISDAVAILSPDGSRWRTGPALPEPRHHVAALAQGGSLYLIGGFGAGASDIWRMRDSVWRGAGERWQAVAPLPMPLAETVGGVIGESLHVVTGRTPARGANMGYADHTDVAAHLVYAPDEDRWTRAAPAPTSRNSAAGAVVEGQLYVVGGRTMDGGNLAVLERYDDANGWVTLAPMPEARGGLAAAAAGRHLYVFGGESLIGRSVYRDVLRYSIDADRWEVLGPMPTPRHGLSAVALGDEIFVIGGAVRAGASGTSAAVEVFKTRG